MAELPSSAKSEATGSVVLLGLGFTTERLARRLLLRANPVFASVREDRFGLLKQAGLRMDNFPRGAVLIHSIPPLPDPDNLRLRDFIENVAPRRVIYISSTGVYGSHTVVTHKTLAEASDEKGIRRLDEERWIASGPWSRLIVRPAAIYGPGRGVHVRVREGQMPRGAGGGVVSRIHVDDLAAALEAAVFSELEGAWPLADDLACSSEEISRWCANLLRLDLKEMPAREFPVAGRKVDGHKIRELLSVELRYPDYRSGILASLAEEAAAAKGLEKRGLL